MVVNSIDTDGVKKGFDLEMLEAVCGTVKVPVIASGGAGKIEDFLTLFDRIPGVDAGLAASIFHFGEVSIRELKQRNAGGRDSGQNRKHGRGSGKMIGIDELKFDEKGLIPAVVVDAKSRKVLTLAYMNRESLRISMEKGLTCFWSRSRQELWLKGETSGNYQHIVSITADCDRDALVVAVEKDGPACHLGTDSCFNDPVYISEERQDFTYEGLMELIRGRKTEKKEGSYTTYLFEKGLDKILKKVGEESTEVIIAAKDRDKKETIYEIADLAYHVMVLMVEAGISLEDIRDELASRHVIDHKVKQEKMTERWLTCICTPLSPTGSIPRRR